MSGRFFNRELLRASAGLLLASPCIGATVARAQDAAYVAKVRVAAETRLDWPYPLLEHSPADPPPSLLAGYAAGAQSYDFFGPAEPDGGSYPLVIFVSPQDRPVGWDFWEQTCRDRGVLFAGVREMGNGKPVAHRVRAVLDVLDDLRGRFEIDPDRTYLAGFSGGAYVACVTAFHLPEYFGGVVCVGYAPQPPEEPWLLARVRQRLSLAIVCGDREPSGPLVEDLYGPWWTGAGVRVEPVILRRHGHTMPGPDVFAEAFDWLEEGVAVRREAARGLPALRIADAPMRDEWSERLLADAKSQLSDTTDAEQVAAGLAQLEGIAQRWPDLPATAAASALIAEHAAKGDRPWEAVREAERRALLRLQAEGYTQLAGDGRKTVAPQRGAYARYAIALWQELSAGNADPDAIAEAQTYIAELQEIADAAPPEAGLPPLRSVRFDFVGDVTLAEAIEHLRGALAGLGYELVVDDAALRAAGVDFDKLYHPRLRAVTFEDIERRFLRRAGLRVQREGATIRLIAVEAVGEAPPSLEGRRRGRD
jgi:predicted esterase